jgi:hypothetical protein
LASAIDICNLALANLGDAADVASLDEGSAQASLCARFYPIARNEILALHDWSFSVRRTALSEVVNTASTWTYAYALPSDMLRAIAVIDPTVGDDDSTALAGTPVAISPQPYKIESAADGASLLYTNVVGAVLRHTVLVIDTGRYPPPLVTAMAAGLSGFLAGPIIKGDTGAAAAQRWRAIAYGRDGRGGLFGQAVTFDANQQSVNTYRSGHPVAWLTAR